MSFSELRTRENSSGAVAEIQQPPRLSNVKVDFGSHRVKEAPARPSRTSQGKVTPPQLELSESPVHETQDYIPDEENNVAAPCAAIGEKAAVTHETVSCPVDQGSPGNNQLSPVKTELIEVPQEPPVAEGNLIAEIEKPEAKPGLNAKIVENRQTGEEASAAWHSILEGGAQKNAVNAVMKDEPAADENLESDNNALPVDADGNLPFYLVDAHEEEFGANPGTIYLFGKVFDAEYQSGCVGFAW